ncbi:hypothetical protein IFM89_021793 [Coptis chinensis]|uniref:GDSL esterase/lipase n=1 Tax=Coptis chinensis TaxID=261450 RepID=A0A835MC07_9MAGN|nr:hypothetical protein IFM89_021793 [Coptis chinensis]
MAERRGVISLILVVLSLSMVTNAAVPAVFIFGDSTADVGTNNNINTSTARADFPQNGIDFPGSVATGRFSNGLNSADFLSKQLGFRRSPPAFLTLLSRKLNIYKHVQRGVNFASGGSGILDVTGSAPYTTPYLRLTCIESRQHFHLSTCMRAKRYRTYYHIYKQGKVIHMGEQIQQFAGVRNILLEFWGQETTDSFLSKSPFFISVGSNDIFEYFALNGTSNKEQYMFFLKSTYGNHLRALYKLGARKFGIISVPPIGCCPSQRIFNTTGGCLDPLNEYSQMFFVSIQALLQQLSSEYKDMKYSLGNAYEMVTSFMENPLPIKIKELKTACCGGGDFNGEVPCSPSAKVCSNREEYLFWDLYHPTQAAAEVAALTLYGGGLKFVTPINFKQLAEAD